MTDNWNRKDKLIEENAHHRRIGVVGLGYVGLPVAVALAKMAHVVGFDINAARVTELTQGIDHTGEVEAEGLKTGNLTFTHKTCDLAECDFYIVAVPTPIDAAKNPDLRMLYRATETVGSVLKPGDIVVYESTVYPGTTEEECVPILERTSGLVNRTDFTVGFSPERINPGDKAHSFTKIKKVISGQDEKSIEVIAQVYGSVVEPGVYRAPSIRVAEAAKIIENTQRDLNIALINELAMIFDRMDIDTTEVLKAASTKWNFLNFHPGLVGGHCIGVDPYYLTYKSTKMGYPPRLILEARRINDEMGFYIADRAIRESVLAGHQVSGEIATILGFTFKENVPDLRNTRVVDVVHRLEQFGARVQIHDPLADPKEALTEYALTLTDYSELKPAAILFLAVAHDSFKNMSVDDLLKLLKPNGVVVDIRGMFDEAELRARGVHVWRL